MGAGIVGETGTRGGASGGAGNSPAPAASGGKAQSGDDGPRKDFPGRAREHGPVPQSTTGAGAKKRGGYRFSSTTQA